MLVQSMLNKIASLSAIQLLSLALNMVRGKVFAVLLGPAAVGVIATIDQLALSVVQLANLSLPFTALKVLSHRHSLGDDAFVRPYTALHKAMLAVALGATIVVLVLIPTHLASLDAQLAPYRNVVTLALLGIPATLMLMFYVNVLAARQLATTSVALVAGTSAVLLIGGVAGYLLGGLAGIYAGAVPATTAVAIGITWWMKRRLHLPWWGDTRGVWVELAAHSRIANLTLSVYAAVATYAILLFTARYVALTRISADAAGFLQASLAIALSIGAVLVPVTSLYFSPYVNRALPPARKMAAAAQFIPRLIGLYVLAALPVLLLPSFVIAILYSQDFAPAVALLPWLIAWQFIYHVSNVYQQLLLGLDDLWGYAIVTGAGNLVATLVMVAPRDLPQLASIGAALVTGALVTAIFTALRLRCRHGLRVRWPSVAVVAVGGAGLVLAAVTGHAAPASSLEGAALRVIVATSVLAALWLATPGTLREDVRTLGAAAVRWWRRHFTRS